MRKTRIKGLNRRIFKRNLKEVLKPEFAKLLDYDDVFEEWVESYFQCVCANCRFGWFEVEGILTVSGHAEDIRTN